MSMLFIDYRSAFNTIVPSKLTSKLWTLGLNTSLCNWILDFLTDRPPGGEGGQQHNRHADPQHVDPLRVRPLLYLFRRLKRFVMGPQILKTLYSYTIERILTGCITTWHGKCLTSNHKALQRVERMAQYITEAELLAIQDLLYTRRVRGKSKQLLDSRHPSHRIFYLLRLGKMHRCTK